MRSNNKFHLSIVFFLRPIIDYKSQMVPSDREGLIVIWLLEDIAHNSDEEIEQYQKEHVYA